MRSTSNRLALAGILALLAARTASASDFEKRCGWVDNPTPGNFTLIDREGSWIMATQGGESAEGMDKIPDLSGNEFVETNGPHGYACACLTVKVDRAAHRVKAISSVKQKLLKDCLGDRQLPSMPK
jgi:hypothetical protein